MTRYAVSLPPELVAEALPVVPEPATPAAAIPPSLIAAALDVLHACERTRPLLPALLWVTSQADPGATRSALRLAVQVTAELDLDVRSPTLIQTLQRYRPAVGEVWALAEIPAALVAIRASSGGMNALAADYGRIAKLEEIVAQHGAVLAELGDTADPAAAELLQAIAEEYGEELVEPALVASRRAEDAPSRLRGGGARR